MPIVQLDPSLINAGGGVNAFQNAFTNALKMRASQQELDDNQYKIDSLKQDRAQQNAMAEMLANPEFDPRTAQGQAQLYGVGGVKNTQAHLKNVADIAETGAKAGKELAGTRKIDLENYLQKFDIMDRLMSPVKDQYSYDVMRQQAAKDPLLADMATNMPAIYEPEKIAAGRMQAMSIKEKIASELAQSIADETRANNLDQTRDRRLTREQQNTQYNLTRGDTLQNRADTQATGHYDADRGMMISKQGVATPVISNGVPLGGKDAKPTAEYMKQAEAYQNMDDALSGYKKVLSGFDTMSMMNPTKRAEMGTAYQNTLLQAKEIYRLGVLNGPDKQILEAIINNPLDVKSIIIPKDALMKQADDLQAIIKRGNDNLAKVNKQPQLSLNSQPSQVTDAASYAKLPSGATYIAPNGKTYTKK